MIQSDPLLSYLRDPRLAIHATSAAPVWLWSADATRVNSSAGHHRNELSGGIVASIVAPSGTRWTDGMFL